MATKRWFEELFEKGVNANVLSGAGSFFGTRSTIQRQVNEIEEAQIRARNGWRRNSPFTRCPKSKSFAAEYRHVLHDGTNFQRGFCDDKGVSV